MKKCDDCQKRPATTMKLKMDNQALVKPGAYALCHYCMDKLGWIDRGSYWSHPVYEKMYGGESAVQVIEV